MRIQDTANRAQQRLSLHAGMTKHSLRPPNEALIHTNNLHEPPLRLPLYCFIQPSGSNYPDAQENVTNRLTERREERGSLLGGLFVNEMYQTWQATEPGSKVGRERRTSKSENCTRTLPSKSGATAKTWTVNSLGAMF